MKYYGYVAKFQLGFRVEFLQITVVHFYFHPRGDFDGFIIEVFAMEEDISSFMLSLDHSLIQQ